MSLGFLKIVEDFRAGLFGGDGNNATNETSIQTICAEPPISNQNLHLYLLAPAAVCTLILSFTKKRNYKHPNCCHGRPALVFAQDVLSRSNRFSYAAAFGSIASLCYGAVFDGQRAVDIAGPVYLKVFLTLLSMIIYGVNFYPLFASLAVDNIVGYIIGSLYVWTLTTLTTYNTFYCPTMSARDAGFLVLRNFPELLCYLYLCFSLPVRLIIRIRKRNIKTVKDYDKFIRTSYSGIHVRDLLRKPKPPEPEPEGIKEKIVTLIKSLPSKILYFSVPNFRYSGRVLAVKVVSMILIYMITVEIFILTLQIAYALEYVIMGVIEAVGQDPQEGESEEIVIVRELIFIVWYILNAVRACVLVSISAAFLINIVMIFHALANYRTLLLGLYKGNPGHLTPKSDKSNASLVVGSMRYAGYQVAYIGWGYFVQFLVLSLISLLIATVITLIRWGLGGWILDKVNQLWPVLLTSLVINLIQLILAKCIFLQRTGNALRLNNRRLFFIVVFFMFFYNIFLGIVSCLMRILKSIIIGALFLPRLDHSVLPRKFQTMDPGFDAYCGFMHVESAHTHPVVVTFIRILKSEVLLAKERKERNLVKTGTNSPSQKYITMDESDLPSRRSRIIRGRWHLLYTLIRNPDLLMKRKMEYFKMIELVGPNSKQEQIAFSDTKTPVKNNTTSL